jgi:diguanylate cyclase (GGDEF)-like protein
MAGLLQGDSLDRVVNAWRRAIRFDPLLSRVAMPDLRPFAVAFNHALTGDDAGELAQACTDLARAKIGPDKVVRISTLLASTIADEAGPNSGATAKSIVNTLGIVCEFLIATMVGDVTLVASRDALTGLGNRRAWDEALTAALKSGAPIAVSSIDLDGLKAINDALGHEAGDAHLKAFAAALAEALPEGVSAYRFAGDEFGTISWSQQGLALEGTFVALRESNEKLSFSFGIASSAETDSPETIFALADQRMYKMKRERKAAVVAK